MKSALLVCHQNEPQGRGTPSDRMLDDLGPDYLFLLVANILLLYILQNSSSS